MISLIRFVYAICVGVALSGLALWIHPVETASFVLWIVAALVTSLVLGAVEKHIESRLRGPLSGATSGLGGNWGPTDTSTLWRHTAYLCEFVIMLSALVVVATPYEGSAFLVIAINVLTPVAAWTIDRQLQLHSQGLYAAAYVLAFFAIASAAMIAVTPGS